jgi:hypothetical protein
MTPYQKKITIAEKCGWKRCEPTEIEYMWRVGAMTTGTATWINPKGEPCKEEWIPDYLNDLNEMHKAWLTLDRKQRISFSQNLRTVVVYQGMSAFNEDIVALCENATAIQRADAYLMTLGYTDV